MIWHEITYKGWYTIKHNQPIYNFCFLFKYKLLKEPLPELTWVYLTIDQVIINVTLIGRQSYVILVFLFREAHRMRIPPIFLSIWGYLKIDLPLVTGNNNGFVNVKLCSVK